MTATSTESPLPPKELGCHRTGFARTCRELVSTGACNRWTAETVTDQTGRVHVRHDCLDNWQVQYLKDNARHQDALGAAVESFRNEMVEGALAVASRILPRLAQKEGCPPLLLDQRVET